MSLTRQNLFQNRVRLLLSTAGVALSVMLILILNGFLSGVYKQASAYLDYHPRAGGGSLGEYREFLRGQLSSPSRERRLCSGDQRSISGAGYSFPVRHLRVAHGYRRAIHEIVHGHVDVDRFHVRGFSEQGTTTTPFDMVILNGMSRFHLAMDALRRIGPDCRAYDRVPTLISRLEASISRATSYSREHLEDPPEIREWVWTS